MNAPRRTRVPPNIHEIAKALESYCRNNGIQRLEIFGSVARGNAKRGSDVDLIATFSQPIGLRFFSMADEMAKILGVPVDLLDRQAVDEMTNPFRKQSILADAREIFSVQQSPMFPAPRTSDLAKASRMLSELEVHALRRRVIAAIPSDDPEEDARQFVLPPEDIPPPEQTP